MDSQNTCEPFVPSSGFPQKESLNPAAPPLATSPDECSSPYLQCAVSRLMESQHNELNLIHEQTRKSLRRQELRKQNIEHLRQIKNQHQPEHPFRRRKSDYSLDLLATSECGTCSTFTESNETGERFSLDWKGSSTSFQSMFDDAVNNNTQESPPQRNLSSDSNRSTCLSDIPDNDSYVNGPDLELLPDGHRHITLGEICVIIPDKNLSGHLLSEFAFEVIEDISFYPKLSNWQVLVSKVIEITPQGAKFYDDDPAIISLPLYYIKLGRNDHVMCLCSNTGVGQRRSWERMNPEDYNVYASHVEIKAFHLSLFAIVVTKDYPEARKTIRAGVGGRLYVPEVPGVEVLFPHTLLLHDIEASVKVLYADEPYDIYHSDPEAPALAAPVVQLGPHGCVFNPHSSDFVTVRLPLPNGKEILERFVHLTFWCSSTTEDEDLEWQQFLPKFTHIEIDDNSLCTVYFSVEHFSFFRVCFDIVNAVMRGLKLRVYSFLPVFYFDVSFKALMSEMSDTGGRFGICVTCYIFDKPLEDHGNFPILVGKCIAPKVLSIGELQIRLESEFFKADTSIGVKELVAVENFTGCPFVIQFGCRFTAEAPDHGNFGSVIVEQPSSHGGNKPVLSFLLNKLKWFISWVYNTRGAL